MPHQTRQDQPAAPVDLQDLAREIDALADARHAETARLQQLADARSLTFGSPRSTRKLLQAPDEGRGTRKRGSMKSLTPAQLNLTDRQIEVLSDLKLRRVIGSDRDGSILRALEKKSLVLRHHNQFPGYVAYTWTLTDVGRAAITAFGA